MSEPNKYREWILETIDSLRSRKARPDLERICRMVRRRHGSDPDRTRTELEKLIQEQTVLKVSYKGSISYRNAAKVQRKSRKKTEFTAAGSGGGAEAARERTKHDHLSSGNNNNNNGDSAHSFTDQEEGDGDDSEPSPDPRTPTSACKKPKPASSPGGADVSLGCGATTGCDVGSGCKEEKASAPRDKGLGQQGAGGCPSAAPGHGTGAGERGGDAGRSTADRGDADRDGKEPAPSGADSHNKTCSGSVGALPPQHKPRQAAPLKPKLRVGGGGSRAAGNHANSELGDRLVASVRSVTEKSLRGGSAASAAAAASSTTAAAAAAAAAAAIRGHMKPLGLKEILGYLSSQERLSEEKLTRGKVKVVMEREVARGRLRRTRCGNITLPLRGTVPEEPPPPPPPRTASADTAGKSAPQDGLNQQQQPPPAAPQEDEPMETGGAEEEREENEEEEQQQQQQQEEEEEEEDPRSSDEDGGLSPVAMTTEPELVEKPREDAEMQTAPEQESPPRCRGQGVGADLSGASDPVNRAPCPPGQGSSPSLSQCNSGQPEEGRAAAPRQNCGAHSQRDGIGHDSEGFNGLESKTEGVSSSCLLTPTASPRHAGISEERPVNGEVSGEGCIKCEAASGSPVDWTVADVVSYFTAAGFPEQAAAFRTQEIDGKSLLLMQRNDVLTGLSIRLGPALKIYERHVKVLQRTHFEEDDC